MTKEITAVAGILWRPDNSCRAVCNGSHDGFHEELHSGFSGGFQGEFLAVERPAGKIMAGYWEFPGGKTENGETPLEALRRELEEELGIRVITAFFWRTVTHEYDHGRVTLHVFHVPRFSGEPASLEGQRLAWTRPEEAKNRKFLPADLPLIEELALAGKPVPKAGPPEPSHG